MLLKKSVNQNTEDNTTTYKDSITVGFKIVSKPVTPAMKLSKKSFVFTGKVVTPGVTVTVGGKTLKKGTDYTVTYSKGRKNAGKYKVTVKMKGNYSGSQTAEFTIKKAANPIKVKVKKATVSAKKVASAARKVASKKVFTVSKNKGKVSYKKTSGSKAITVKANGTLSVKKGTPAGTYKVKVKVTAAGNANYKAGTKAVTVTVIVK